MRAMVCTFAMIAFMGGQAYAIQEKLAPPQRIRVRVRLVPVNVTVCGKDGKPVLDLKREDFTILENGTPQEIRHFELQSMRPDVANPAGAMVRRIPTAELALQTGRTFLILLGRGVYRLFDSMESLRAFVRGNLLPQDRIAVFAYNRATSFTTDHEQVAQVLERYARVHEKIESELKMRERTGAARYGILKEVPIPLQTQIDSIFWAATGGPRQVTPARIPEGRRWETSLSTALENLDENTDTDLPLDDYVYGHVDMAYWDLQKIVTCIEYLRHMEGEKHLLLFVEKGLPLRWDRQTKIEQELGAIANDARVAIHTFQAGGVELHPSLVAMDVSRASPQIRLAGSSLLSWMQFWQLTSLRWISEYTGGLTSIHRDIAKALDRVDEVTRAKYLLGYYPASDRWDGTYRRIEVRVKRPGVNVSYRQGYFARERAEPYDHDGFLAYSHIAIAAGYSGSDIKDIRFKVNTTETKTEGGEPRIRVDIQIDPTSIGLKNEEGLHVGKLYISYFYATSARRHLGDAWQVVNISLREETFQSVLEAGFIPFSAVIPLKAPKQIVKVVIYDSGSGRVGSTQVQLR